MSPENFTFWLNGFFELSGVTTLNEQQVQVIKEHLALVLHKVTPSTVGSGTPPQQSRGPYTFPTYPDPSVPWYKPWEITCVAGDANIPLKTYSGPHCGLMTSEEGGVCKKCQLASSQTQTIVSASADQLPIINVKTHLSC